MNNDKSKTTVPKFPVAAAVAAAAPSSKSSPLPATPAVRLPPLFRRIDWLTLLITFTAVMVGYYMTLAPEQTLEDSGELATGSFYAGIPHPPGYPVWTIYTWVWTRILPFRNIAWRVAFGHAVSGAMAAALLAMLVSRGSSLLMEGIEDLKAMAGKWESAICMTSGFVAGMLLGFNGFMWSQAVIVEVYAFSVCSFMVVLLCLLRWIYAPHQRRYLYFALFFHGVCFTNHQTLVVAAMGIEVAIAAANFRMGRNLFLGNSILYLAGLILKQQHMLTALEANPAILTIFHVVGTCSVGAYFWFTILTRETFPELCLDASLAGFILLVAAGLGNGGFFYLLALGALAGVFKFGWDTRKLGMEWLVVIGCGICWILGASFYFYMPLAGMSDPPMMWGYPRTVEGFIHAFTRGQYEKTNPTNIIGDPGRFITQLGMLWKGVIEEFNWVYAFLALIPFLFFRKLHRRERAWLIGLTAIYLCMGVLLLILLNPPPDRQAQDLVRVFFTASHTVVAMLVGYGLTLIAAYMATHYTRFRVWGMAGAAGAVALALYSFTELTTETFFGKNASPDLSALMSFTKHTFTTPDQYGLPVFAGLLLIGMAIVYLASLLVYRNRAPLAITLVIFALMPVHSIMTHWSDNEQHNHWFGYWFGHDMFTPPFKGSDGKPLYPEMTRNTVLFGGTDPGRFCPTYSIFCDSFIPHDCQPADDQKFDRRDVRLITQNALADGTYLNYIRAQYNRSAQTNDPPFFRELFRLLLHDQEYQTNFLARAAAPLDNYFNDLGDRIEKERRTGSSRIKPNDLTDVSSLAAKLRPGAQSDPLSKFLYDHLSKETQGLLTGKSDDAALRRNLARDLDQLLEAELDAQKLAAQKRAEKDILDQELEAGSTSESKRRKSQELAKEIAELDKVEPLYQPDRFKQVELSEYLHDFINQNPRSHTRIRLNRMLLEAAYPKELAVSLGGVYPDMEIYSASPDDSAKCFQDYLQDAQRRLQQNQLRPGEDVKVVDNRVQVSGQVAVMAINGLLTKVIFEHNPKLDFYVEESFPLDWMYPYLTPAGIIMKINRNPLPELTEDIVRRDHEFWSQYSNRLIGNWITYDTPVKDIAAFVEKVYLRRDFTGFTGDRKFVRDDSAQKAFSKLRSSIGGIYAWRINDPNNRNPAVQQRMIKEADFAFRQSFAFCPYSPEAVFRYVNLLLSTQRMDDALIVAQTCLKLDPFNGQVIDLVKRLSEFKKQQAQQTQQGGDAMALQQTLAQMEKEVQQNPSNFQAAFNLASAYLQAQQTNRAVQILERVLNDPRAEQSAILAIAQAFAQISDFARLETTLAKLVKVAPNSPEAWYDLAALQATMGKTKEALSPLSRAIELSAKRRTASTNGRDLLVEAQKDVRFAAVRVLPEFQQIAAPK